MRFDGRPETLDTIREIAENILDPVFLVDRLFNVWYFNRAFEQAVGVRMSSRQYKDRPCHELLGLSICKDACIMKQAVATNKNVRLAEIPGTTAGAELKNFHINAIPVTNAEGQPFGSLIFLRDITSETQIHQKYKELVQKNSGMSLSGQVEGNIIDVIQLLAFLQKTGQLSLARAPGDEGAILFERGRMSAATYGNVGGKKALDRMFAWPECRFSFSPKSTTTFSVMLEGNSDFILMDIVRERDELMARRAELPALDRTVTILTPIPEGETHTAADRSLGQLLANGRTIAQAVEEMQEADTHILLALLRLRDSKLLAW